MAAPSTQAEPASPRAELLRFVRASVDEVRRTNALALAWLRVGLRSLTLVLYLRTLATAPAAVAAQQAPAAVANVLHLALGVTVLVLLWRRRLVPWAILAGAAADFTAVYVGAWRGVNGPDPLDSTIYYMGAFEMMLLFAALTLRTRVVAVLAAVTTGYMLFLLSRLPVWDFGSWLVVLTLLAFALATTFAGTRMVGLASRTAAETYGAGLARRHRDELAAANAALQDAREKAELLGRLIVHDLRSPVATVSLGLGVLEEALAKVAPPPSEVREALEMSRAEVRRLGDMLGDLLAVSRLEEGVRARRTSTELEPLVAACARGLDAQASREGISVSVRVPAGLVAPLDAPLVRRLVENLAGNALRHVAAGDRIEISAESAGGSLRLAVRNSGPPVPAEVRGRLFEKNVSGEARSWRHQGLGLHFCRLAAEAHGGTIALVERAGWSVSFEAELPLG